MFLSNTFYHLPNWSMWRTLKFILGLIELSLFSLYVNNKENAYNY